MTQPVSRRGGGSAAGAVVTSVPEITRLLAHIAEWQDGHGKPGGRADMARRLVEAHALFDEISTMLAEVRLNLLGTAMR